MPAAYAVALDGRSAGEIPANGSVTFSSLDVGKHEVELVGVPSNCSTTTANPALVSVTAGVASSVDMVIECRSPTSGSGSIEITVATTGLDLDPDGFQISVDAGSPVPITIQGSITVGDLDAGQHEVMLSDVRGNCIAADGPSRTVTVIEGQTAEVLFVIDCDWNSRILFRSFDDDIYVMKPDGTAVKNVTDHPARDLPRHLHAWSPSGDMIAFERESDVYVVNRDGSGLKNVTNHPARDKAPAWSPDGSRIVFASDRDGSLYGIYIIDVSGSGLSKVTNETDDHDPVWSPSHDGIATSSYRVHYTNSEIFAMNLDGSNAVNVSNHSSFDGQPIWSPDGLRLAFLSNRTSATPTEFDIFVANADGSGLRNASNSPLGNAHPAWSPDGQRIAFRSERDGNREIYVVNADGSGLRRLTHHPAADDLPTWSPDGSRIAFASLRDGHSQVYVIAPDGTQLQNISNTSMWHSSPSWSPWLY